MFHKIIGIVILGFALLLAESPSGANAENEMASRIQAKITQIGARATELRESGADVSSIQTTMLQNGRPAEAETILDSVLANLGSPAAGNICNPNAPMTVSGQVTVHASCSVGGDLTVTGHGVLHFDYTGGSHLVVHGNVTVQHNATLWIEGRPGDPAVFVIDNAFNQQRSMTSTDDATIRLDHVEFRTQESEGHGTGSISMTYDARDRSSFEVTGAALHEETAWLLANLHDSARLNLVDVQGVPTEIYIRDASSAKLRGRDTQTGIWLDAGGVRGTLKLPDVDRPFSWRIGAGAGLNVAWSLQVDDAQPGLGVEVKPDSALTIVGHGAQAPATGELKISYFVIGAQETLDGLEAGLQNRRIGNRLTLQNVQLGPIAWQVYAGNDTDLTIRHSVINEIGIFGRDAKVRVDHSVLQLAVLAALGPGSLLDIRDSEIWNQAVEVANDGHVVISGSEIHGTHFLARDPGSTIAIDGDAFYANPAGCTPAKMVNITTGQPNCNPFRPPGMPQKAGPGRITCSGHAGCDWDG
jgi:hypothetical protein